MKQLFNFFSSSLFIMLLVACSGKSPQPPGETKQVDLTDMAGRSVKLPAHPARLLSNNLPGSILLYALAADELIARNNQPNPAELQFCSERFCSLPQIGSWFMDNGTRNTEELIRLKPDLILSAGNIGKKAIEVSDRDQQLLQVPVVLVSTALPDLPETFRILGDLLGQKEKAAELLSFYQSYIPDILQQTATLDSLSRPRVFLAMGEDGLQTAPANSLHSQVLDYAGGRNVATVQYGEKTVSSHTAISMEQLMRWNPEIILACGFEAFNSKALQQKILRDPRWKSLRAVKTGQVYQVPASPWLWLDRPPSVNQLLGVIWLAKLLHPDRFRYNVEDAVSNFYVQFYHHRLSAAELNALLSQGDTIIP